jgi:predicted LPLAT superfamily acyltransferase
LLTGKSSQFNIKINNSDLLEPLLKEKRGFILLGSHLGSFEVLRSYGVLEKGLNVSVFMNERNAGKSNSVLHELFPQIQQGIIQPGEPGSVLKIKERLDEGGIVGVLGDRMFSNSKAVRCDFIGSKVPFPQGPIRLAASLQVPVILFFGIYRGGSEYEIYFESFADPVTIESRSEESIQPWVQRYAQRLEYYARTYPYNWFNFYDFWHETNT